MKIRFNARVTSFGELALGAIFLTEIAQANQYCVKTAPPPGHNSKQPGGVTLLPGLRDYDGLPGFIEGEHFRKTQVLDLSETLYVEPVLGLPSVRFGRDNPSEGVGNLVIAGGAVYLKARVGRGGPVMAVNLRTGETAAGDDPVFRNGLEVSEWDIVEISAG